MALREDFEFEIGQVVRRLNQLEMEMSGLTELQASPVKQELDKLKQRVEALEAQHAWGNIRAEGIDVGNVPQQVDPRNNLCGPDEEAAEKIDVSHSPEVVEAAKGIFAAERSMRAAIALLEKGVELDSIERDQAYPEWFPRLYRINSEGERHIIGLQDMQEIFNRLRNAGWVK